MAEACTNGKIKPGISFHILRHTWASLAVMNGTPLLVVAKNLGTPTAAWSSGIMAILPRALSPMRSEPVPRATASRATSGWCRCGKPQLASTETESMGQARLRPAKPHGRPPLGQG